MSKQYKSRLKLTSDSTYYRISAFSKAINWILYAQNTKWISIIMAGFAFSLLAFIYYLKRRDWLLSRWQLPAVAIALFLMLWHHLIPSDVFLSRHSTASALVQHTKSGGIIPPVVFLAFLLVAMVYVWCSQTSAIIYEIGHLDCYTMFILHVRLNLLSRWIHCHALFPGCLLHYLPQETVHVFSFCIYSCPVHFTAQYRTK